SEPRARRWAGGLRPPLPHSDQHQIVAVDQLFAVGVPEELGDARTDLSLDLIDRLGAVGDEAARDLLARLRPAADGVADAKVALHSHDPDRQQAPAALAERPDGALIEVELTA